MGNYFGAIEPMVDLQVNENENLLFIVDYHAITVPQDPEQLRRNILFATATYLACGIDPEKTILFQQSRVQEHTELTWILNCLAYMGEIERMTQYKDKALGKGESVSVGLFDYPILMAADILLYDTAIVPVGEDQKQHVELARDLAERFNHRFGETFVIPKPQIREQGARIMGLDNPEKKMSKSAPNEKNYLSLMDDEATILKKIKSAVTDSGSTIEYTQDRKGLANLLTIYSLVTQKPIKALVEMYEGKGYGAFKVDLAQAISVFLAPIQQTINDLLSHPDHLLQQLDLGTKRAQALASKKMELVRQKIGVRL